MEPIQVPFQQAGPQRPALKCQKGEKKTFCTSSGVFIADADDVLGRGTYGVVYRVRHQQNPSIKKAVKTFCPETMDEAEGIPSTTLREINALKTIQHPNVMTAEEVVIPMEHALTDMFVLMELCRGTLKDKIIELIKVHLHGDPSWRRPAPGTKLPEAYVKEAKIIAWQLLNALAVVHSRGVMHRDLKPVNIMWGFDDLLKLGDFGLARFVRGNQNADNSVLQQTGEVQTMWYRAPEVLLGDEKYGLLVDDWSIGCVIAELFRFRRSSAGRVEPDPLFHGRSDVETLMIIFETFGTPNPEANFSQRYLAGLPYWSNSFPNWVQGNLKERIPLLDPLGFEVLEQLLRISPSERRAARFLLDHPWFNDVRSELQQFVPWYHGFEKDYTRMMAVDRLPLPRTIKDITAEKKLKQEALSAQNSKLFTQRTTTSSTTSLASTNASTTTMAKTTKEPQT
ncbi:cyclin-dependent kinase 1-like [Hylaeus volcanicus]|uniref:cyclin-dependent kinase 1-like n=1 Tax=Hylaeus volcanicus TaxID=313075 RepID=UPI0023B7A350|nr:cyclin-dependent kinase 1-like [Hylaeus volcanicus]